MHRLSGLDVDTETFTRTRMCQMTKICPFGIILEQSGLGSWLANCLAGCLPNSLAGQLAGALAGLDWLAGCSGRLAGCLASLGWLAGWLHGWLTG